ncbi:MAG: D-alanine--D-alanine ligase [Gammaproteobacteria bacterium]|nr:D-alanine--D-alanine ligase [Gammaproteobacteria bacterium]
MSDLKKQFGKVAVLMGGWSAEREVSLKSGDAVLAALLSAGVDASAVDFKKNDIQQLSGFDRVFNIVHGRGGEDGVLQGLLEFMALPYTGSGVLGSALAMDKIRTKEIWKSQQLQTPAYRTVRDLAACLTAIEELGLPLIMKPALEGSSIGISKVTDIEQAEAAFDLAAGCNSDVLVEAWIEGEEYSASILNNRVLPLIKLKTANQFYDYDAKYVSDATEYICPCGLSESKEIEMAEIATRAFAAISGAGWGRIDFMLDAEQKPWLIEANTVPGMTDHSLVPMAARQAGLTMEELVLEILKTSEERNV